MGAFADLFQSAAAKTVLGKAGRAIDVLGKATGNRLPELNISESLESYGGSKPGSSFVYVKPAGASSSGGQSTVDWSKYQSTPGGEVKGLATTGGGGGGGGGGNSGGGSLTADMLRSQFGFNDQNVINSILNSPEETARYLRELGLGSGDDERARIEAEQERIRSGIDTAYAPIFETLDKMVGLLGPQKEDFLSTIESTLGPQREVVGREEEAGLKNLEAAKGSEEELAKSSIRSLEEDVRNQLKSYGGYFGGIGAGDSSATGQAAGAIGKAALKARAQIRSTLAEAVNKIDLKSQEVKNLAANQLSKIETWKADKIAEIQTYFADRLNQLETQRMSAQGTKAAAISNMIQNTEQDYVNRLRQLDDEVFNYRSAISQWQMQRAADLEDYQTKLAMSASYSRSSGDTAKAALSAFNTAMNSGLTQSQAKSLVESQYGEGALSGLELSAQDETRRKESPLAELQSNVIGALSPTGATKTGINLGPLNISW